MWSALRTSVNTITIFIAGIMLSAFNNTRCHTDDLRPSHLLQELTLQQHRLKLTDIKFHTYYIWTFLSKVQIWLIRIQHMQFLQLTKLIPTSNYQQTLYTNRSSLSTSFSLVNVLSSLCYPTVSIFITHTVWNVCYWMCARL